MAAVTSKEKRIHLAASRGQIETIASSSGDRAGQQGLHQLSIRRGEPPLLYVPDSYSFNRPMALAVMLHGAGGVPGHSIELVRGHADRLGFIVLAPRSRAGSWDLISTGGFGPDVIGLSEALKQVFADYWIDPRRIVIAGFSDGASYALSLGLTNGELFSWILAFSPGFMAPAQQIGKPQIFVSHGLQDPVLPIERCSRRIVPRLRGSGYTVDYREFPGGHIVPPELAAAAFESLG